MCVTIIGCTILYLNKAKNQRFWNSIYFKRKENIFPIFWDFRTLCVDHQVIELNFLLGFELVLIHEKSITREIMMGRVCPKFWSFGFLGVHWIEQWVEYEFSVEPGFSFNFPKIFAIFDDFSKCSMTKSCLTLKKLV